MASCSNAPSSESGGVSRENMFQAVESAPQSCGSPARHEEDEDEDEDIDFNPFLKESPVPEASSSLSSGVEEPDDSIVCDALKAFDTGTLISSQLTAELQGCTPGEHKNAEEELPLRSAVAQVETDEESQTMPDTSCLIGNQIFQGNSQGSETGDVDGVFVNEAAHSEKPGVLSGDDEDAICKRTRARYSLASFTLDELESFLQETDDEEGLQNVDDEEEYKKFLAAVLLGGDTDGTKTQENENVDDEDEDNDADFEIELEEALDSDLDDRQIDKSQKSPKDGFQRRPTTRQNKSRSTTCGNKNKLLEQAKRPLRPLLPSPPVGPNALIPTPTHRSLAADVTPGCSAFPPDSGSTSGFNPYQIGQLYCLIHEHVQLLVQIYSLCVLDPSRQQTAFQIQDLLLEILQKRDQVLAWRNVPYPADIFRAPYLNPSVVDGSSRLHQEECMGPMNNVEQVTSASGHVEATKASSQVPRSFPWAPVISGPLLSILDVAPLNLVKNFLDDISFAMQEHRRHHVESRYDICTERDPLFFLPNIPSATEVNGHGMREDLPLDVNRGSSSPSQPHKKSLAAVLVEATKKQSVAMVPKEVAKLAQAFFPLFNQALFPHKPPLAAIANRVLFTDSEDELLALGMMEYNTDWKAIQERFLPCKSKHQIFVRQKNRCSSKAPENPIKTVRRMKTSPLTAEEMRYIQEGLKIYKLDWMSVCKFVVPHRDPSLLPRQWRTALGTQKSYKNNELKRQKRRAYEVERRGRKAADPANWPHGLKDIRAEGGGGGGGENSSGDDCVYDPEEAYVHEAFLADWRPGISGPIPSQHQRSQTAELLNNQIAGEAQNHAGNIHQYITRLNHPKHPFSASPFSTNPLFSTNLRMDTERLVKLAPNLPPVNLPRNVRVISQVAYRMQPHVAAPSCETRAARVSDSHQDESRVVMERSVGAGIERFNRSELQMHPLLFQGPVDGYLHYPSNFTAGTNGSSSVFPGRHPQLNLSLFRSPNLMICGPNSLTKSATQDIHSTSSGIEFHPLLQSSDVAETNTEASGRFDTSSGPAASSAHPRSPLDKANELDLEIHLSSTSRKKDAETRERENLGVTYVNGENSGPSYQPLDSMPPTGALVERGSQEPVNGFDQGYTDALDDQSHPEIVMEREELSDSEEDFEEQVEFECEEMTDSEEEDMLGAELVSEANNKDAQNLPAKVVHIEPEDGGDEDVHKPCGSDAARNSCSPSLGLDRSSDPKNNKLRESWLRLHPSGTETPAAKKSASLRPSRSSRKKKEPAKSEAGSLMMSPTRRPRKRRCKNG